MLSLGKLSPGSMKLPASFFCPPNTRHDSHAPNTRHAQIDRVHNHNSRATTGPTPCRPGLAPQHHRLELRSPALSRARQNAEDVMLDFVKSSPGRKAEPSRKMADTERLHCG